MYSKFPFSMEDIPRQKSFGCLSLKFGSIFSALVIILFTVLSLAQCLAYIQDLVPGAITLDNIENILMFCFAIGVIISHFVTILLSTIMLVGTIREKAYLMKPWVVWTSFQVMVSLLLLVYATTINMVLDHMDSNTLFVYIVSFLILLIRFYMLMLVASYYKQLVEENAERLKTLLNNETWYTA